MRTGFIQAFGKRLTDVVNSDLPDAEKKARLLPLIDADVDVEAVARFCLGRFARTSTPQQVSDFTRLFHQVLINNITSKIGEYKGVTFAAVGLRRRAAMARPW